MAEISLGGKPINTIGELPSIGEMAKEFILVKNDMSKVRLSDFAGSRLILNVFPSIDTGICAQSTRTFNAAASGLDNTKVLCISRDLPFATKRFCGAEGLQDVIMLSDFAIGAFGKEYGLEIIDSAFQNLHSRVVIVLDVDHKIIYTEQAPEIGSEPNYEAALAILG